MPSEPLSDEGGRDDHGFVDINVAGVINVDMMTFTGAETIAASRLRS